MSNGLYGGLEPREIPAFPMAEVARHMGLSIHTLKSWVRGRTYPTGAGNQRFRPVIQLPDPSISQLSFVNLVEIHILHSIRRDHQIALPKIRTAVRHMSALLNIKHPLADIDWLTDRTDLLVEMLDETLINASREGQVVIREVVTAYLQRIDRDSAGKAARLYPFVSGSNLTDPKLIVIDPNIYFGRPVLVGSRIPTDVIFDRFQGGEKAKDIAAEYEREVSDIEFAIEYERRADERRSVKRIAA